MGDTLVKISELESLILEFSDKTKVSRMLGMLNYIRRLIVDFDIDPEIVDEALTNLLVLVKNNPDNEELYDQIITKCGQITKILVQEAENKIIKGASYVAV